MARQMPLDGKVVEVHGLESSAGLQRLDSSNDGRSIPADLNGSAGRVMGMASGSARNYAVELWDESMVVGIPEQNLRPYVQAAPEEGGFDLAFPGKDPASLMEFGALLGDVLDAKGWAMVQMPTTDAACEAACAEAASIRRFDGLKQEFIPDYLGHGARGKIHVVPPPEQGHAESGLQRQDENFTYLAQAVSAHSWHSLNFRCMGERWPGIVWVPYATRREEMSYEAEPLNDDDVDEGLLEDHLKFLRRRKLGCMMWLDAEGGHVTLSPAPGRPERAVTLPVAKRKLLVFCADRMTFGYKPQGRFVVMQSWILEPEPKFQVAKLEGHPMMTAEVMGIMNGRPYPEGDRVHIMSIMNRLPGGGSGPDEYWSALLDGTDGMLEIPNYRWDTDLYCTKEDEERQLGKCYTIHGGFCSNDEIYSFDNRFFDISDEEARFMSPSQRVVMEDAYSVLWRGGHNKASLNGKNIGVFLGDTGSDWWPFNTFEHTISRPGEEPRNVSGVTSMNVTGAHSSVVPCRLSHCLNMVGPTNTVDTACSSSLTATGVAMQWLRQRKLPEHLQHLNYGRLQEAVAGGICCQIGVGTYLAMCGLGMLSANGRCFTFDESGDGYARGEGCGLIYLKSSENESDKFDQLACLLGCCVNQDGRSASMTAPNGPSQQACIAQSMREAGNEARDINLAECHGTGTALGDPIEVGALRNVMEPRDTTLALTSSKSNIGHLEGSAGIAGFLKCVLMLMAGTCPPNAHCRQLNPHLAVNGFPCFFDTEAVDAGMNSALTGVSSFGFGGTNGRCDIWGAARFGPNRCGKILHQEIDQMYTTCPVTLGKIDYLTGEPLLRESAASRGRQKKSDILRDEFAAYDVSRYAYDGGFRYRQSDLPDDKEEEFPQDSSLYICGSWSGFNEKEEMDRDGDNLFTTVITLGEERYEIFDLSVDGKTEMALFPAVDRAGQRIAVEGPEANKEHKRWIIDGRDDEMPAGTVLQITFKFSFERPTVTWKEVGDKRRVLALPHRHTYHVVGSFSKWRPVALQCADADTMQEWFGTFRIGQRGRDAFQIWKDGDKRQAVYPVFPEASGSGEEARGPDELGVGRNFQVQGAPGEEVNVSLYVEDGKVVVRTRTSMNRQREWESLRGWGRHNYCLIHPGAGRRPIPMEMDPRRPGVFTCTDNMGQDFDKEMGAYCHSFQVAVDGDSRWVFYPQGAGGSLSGEAIVVRPGGEGKGSNTPFTVYSPAPGRTFQVTLDLTAEDRRKTVTWAWVRPEAVDAAAE